MHYYTQQNNKIIWQVMIDQIFATQIHSTRYRVVNDYQSVEIKKKNGNIRVKQVKSEMKKVNEQYNQTLKSFFKAKNSLDKTHHRTHQLKVDFLKTFGAKKLQLHERMLQNRRKQQDEQLKQENSKRIKAMKLTNELGLMYTRNQNELVQSKLREKNKKQQEHFKNEMKMKKSQWMDEAKEKYLNVKKGELELLARKSNNTEIMSNRAHHNYLHKVHKQIQMLGSYNELMEQVNSLNVSLPIVKRPPQDLFSKTFVTTTKNTFRQTQ